MGFETEYNAIFEDLKETLEGLSSVKQVLYKESSDKFKLKKWPCAMINPGNFTLDPSDGMFLADVGNYALTINGEIIILIREVDADDWYDETLGVMGDIIDAIFADQTLGGTCFIAWPSAGGPGQIDVRNALYFGSSVGIRALRGYP